ncbi:MAG: nitrile hydratase subunit alpha [Acidobacteria bacterium]|nr:nitrile hydratase subunit alpha [Acidobacteriota bacterium]
MDDTHIKLSKLIAAAWADDKLRRRLVKDPHTVLKEHGIPRAAGTKVKVLSNTAKLHHLVITRKPEGDFQEGAGKKIANFTICFL